MSQNEMIYITVGVLSGICFLWGFVKRPIHVVFLVVRGCFFVLLLYTMELIGIKYGFDVVVTVNAVTATVSALLGVPGILLLYLVRIVLL